jgi:hypothetical protein
VVARAADNVDAALNDWQDLAHPPRKAASLADSLRTTADELARQQAAWSRDTAAYAGDVRDRCQTKQSAPLADSLGRLCTGR